MHLHTLLAIKKQIFTIADNLTISKSKGYGSNQDTLFNVRLPEHLGITSTELGIYIRILDKITRLGRILQTSEKHVGHESLIDTIVDTINYLTYIIAIRNEKDTTIQHTLNSLTPVNTQPDTHNPSNHSCSE